MNDEKQPVMQWRKKPVVIEAVQWNGHNVKEVMDFMAWRNAAHDEKTGLVIHTLEGDHQALPGDWIIKGVKGEFYPCKPDIFAATYEPAASPAHTESAAPVAMSADQLYNAIEDVLLHHRMENWLDAHGSSLSLVDRLCDYGAKDVSSGQHEIRLICDEIYNDVLTKCAPAPSPVSGADERAAFERALKETYQMVDPFDPSPAGSYSRGVHNGIIAALKTIRENFERAATIQTPTGQQALSDAELRAIQDVLREVDPKWRERGEFGVKPVGQIISAIRDLARAAAPQAVALTQEQIEAIAKGFWVEFECDAGPAIRFDRIGFAHALLNASKS